MAYVNKAKVNPCSPIVYLKIGDTEITLKNKPEQADSLISLSLTESALETYSDIVITLFDDTALVMEYELKRGYTRIEFRYGADETAMSSTRICHAVDYDIDFEGGGVMLTINCSNGAITDSDEKPKEYKGKISDVVAQIFKDLQYEVGNIVETDDEPNETGYSNAGNDLCQLLNQLCQSAKSIDGDSGYTFYTKDKDGKIYGYFEPLLKQTCDDYSVYEFIIGQEHENIISFKPEYKGLLQYMVGNQGSTSLDSSADTTSTTGTDSSTIDANASDYTAGAKVDEKVNEGNTSTFDRVNMGNDFGATPSDGVDDEVTRPDLTVKSPMQGKTIYSRGKVLNVYTGTNSNTCKKVAQLSNNQSAIIYSETAMWYYVKTQTGKLGWVKKLETTTIEPPTTQDEYKEYVDNGRTQTGETSTDSSGYTQTNTPSNNSEVLSKLGLVAPGVDELTNVIIRPYDSGEAYKCRVGSSSYNPAELARIAEYMYTMASALQPTAQLELKGNAKIDTQCFVALVVLTKDKLFHHSSGLYQIIEVSHHIEMGSYTTTLNLLKRAMSIDEEGNIKLMDVNDGVLSQNLQNQLGANGTTGTTQPLGNGTLPGTDQLKTYIDKYIGRPYVWGGGHGTGDESNLKGFDCSGFCSQVLYDMGLKKIGSTVNFMQCEPVIPWDKSQIKPGDCMVYRTGGGGHVVMVVDQNTIAHAPKRGDVIKYADIEYHWNYMQKKGGKIVRPLANDNYKRGS